MKIEMTLRIKPEHGPKEFKKGMGKGVLVTQVADLGTNFDINTSINMAGLIELEEEFLHKYCEVVIKEIKDE